MDYEPIEAFLIGECGMTTAQAGFTTLREFNIKMKARQESEQAKWELARWQMFLAMQMQPFVKPQNKPKDIRAWIPFPWEKATQEKITKDDCKITDTELEQLGILLKQFKSRRKT